MGMTTSGDVVVSVPASVAVDGLGIPNEASTSTDNVVRFDVDGRPRRSTWRPARPTRRAMTRSGSPSCSTRRWPGSTLRHVSLSGTTVGGSLMTTVTGSGADYTVSVGGMTGTGVVEISVPAGAAQDAAGNPSRRHPRSQHGHVGQAPPTVTIDQAADQPDPTNGPVRFDVVFSAPSPASTWATSTSPGAPSAATWPLRSPGRGRCTW